jgi:hypothetical protein
MGTPEIAGVAILRAANQSRPIADLQDPDGIKPRLAERAISRTRTIPATGGPPSDGSRSPPITGQISTGNTASGGRAVMFGGGFEDHWYEVPGVPGLELSGDLRFRGRRGLRKLRHDGDGRPYVLARKVVGPHSTGAAREGKIMLHRAVMAVVQGRRLGSAELVCHRDDDPHNNWPQNLYLGITPATRPTACGTGVTRGETATRVPSSWMLRSTRSDRPYPGASGWGTSPAPTACTRARSAGSNMVYGENT